jgi:prevent-host-death family protein
MIAIAIRKVSVLVIVSDMVLFFGLSGRWPRSNRADSRAGRSEDRLPRIAFPGFANRTRSGALVYKIATGQGRVSFQGFVSLVPGSSSTGVYSDIEIARMMATLLRGTDVKASTIAQAKNNLSHLIHQLERDEVIQLTRYGKPVAVMMSESHYQKMITPNRSLNAAIQTWREQLDASLEIGFSDDELHALRHQSTGRACTWDE